MVFTVTNIRDIRIKPLIRNTMAVESFMSPLKQGDNDGDSDEAFPLQVFNH